MFQKKSTLVPGPAKSCHGPFFVLAEEVVFHASHLNCKRNVMTMILPFEPQRHSLGEKAKPLEIPPQTPKVAHCAPERYVMCDTFNILAVSGSSPEAKGTIHWHRKKWILSKSLLRCINNVEKAILILFHLINFRQWCCVTDHTAIVHQQEKGLVGMQL